MASKVMVLFLFLSLALLYHETRCSSSTTEKSWFQIGYYISPTELPISEINSELFTHLILGFDHLNDSLSNSISNNSTGYEKVLSSFTGIVKRKNPPLITILSVPVDREQSRILLSSSSQSYSPRKSFIESSISTARLHGFEGLDLYGLEPSTSSEMANLETLLADCREAIDSEAKNKNLPTLLLVMLVSSSPSFGTSSFYYPIKAMKKKLDWIHLKSYDNYFPTETKVVYPQAALYDPSNTFTTTDNGVQEWIKLGFPSSRLVLGLPYYGFAWTLVDPKVNPIGAPSTGPAVTLNGKVFYNFLRWYIIKGHGAKSFYNDTYVMNYCTVGQSWINYDDVEAIRAKISYAKKMGLLGYFALHVGLDDNWILSRAAQGGGGENERNKKRLLRIVLATTTMLFLLLGTTTILCVRQKLLNSKGKIRTVLRSLLYAQRIGSVTEDLDGNSYKMQVFSYSVIEAATDSFSDQNKVGQGGFGPVYKGTLENGRKFAVKRLSKTSNQGQEEFKNEVSLTANLQHVNLVRVLGYCTENEETMIIYEYMPNKSLDFYLYDPSRKHFLDWNKRVRIVGGITQGLLYLQEYSNSTIIHRDLKASNILLDHEMNPRISDFGLARAFRKDEHEASTDRIVGTYGYVPPEYVKNGIYSMKYDVYSFGVLLLQIISGKRNACKYGIDENLNLSQYAHELWKEGQGTKFIDSILDDSSSTCKTLRCMHIALLCVQENPIDRPSMLKVSSMLKSEAEPVVEPTRPAFSINDDDGSNKLKNPRLNVKKESYSVNDLTISQVVPR